MKMLNIGLGRKCFTLGVAFVHVLTRSVAKKNKNKKGERFHDKGALGAISAVVAQSP